MRTVEEGEKVSCDTLAEHCSTMHKGVMEKT